MGAPRPWLRAKQQDWLGERVGLALLLLMTRALGLERDWLLVVLTRQFNVVQRRLLLLLLFLGCFSNRQLACLQLVLVKSLVPRCVVEDHRQHDACNLDLDTVVRAEDGERGFVVAELGSRQGLGDGSHQLGVDRTVGNGDGARVVACALRVAQEAAAHVVGALVVDAQSALLSRSTPSG